MYAHVDSTGHLRFIRSISFRSASPLCSLNLPATAAPSPAPSPTQPARLCRAPQSTSRTQSAATTESTTSDSAGHFQFTNVPLNPYHLVVSSHRFCPVHARMSTFALLCPYVKSVSPSARSSTVVERYRHDLLETDSTFHTDVDRQLIQQTPARESVFLTQLARHALLARRRGRLQRSLPRPRRSRL